MAVVEQATHTLHTHTHHLRSSSAVEECVRHQPAWLQIPKTQNRYCLQKIIQMWKVRHHNKGVGTSPSHPRPKRIFSTDLNRNRVITAKKNNDVLCTSPHQGRVGTSRQRESVRCAQGRTKFSNQKKVGVSLSKNVICVWVVKQGGR